MKASKLSALVSEELFVFQLQNLCAVTRTAYSMTRVVKTYVTHVYVTT
jgi:hypothetical protein